MQHTPFVFLDIETTGGNSKSSRIIEIGAVRVENNKIVGRFNELIYPGVEIPWYITNLTGITNSMVWEAPKFEHIAPRLEQFLNGAIFIAHNVSFDYSFIKEEFGRIGIIFKKDRLCTVKLSRLLYPDQKKHSLDAIIKEHHIEVLNRHRGYDDAYALYAFYKTALKANPLETYRAMGRVITKAR